MAGYIPAKNLGDIMKKYFKNILIYTLIITILFNTFFAPKVYAEAVTISVGTKVLITLLGAMGILTTVKNLDSIPNFLNSFANWYQEKKAIANLFKEVGQKGLQSMYEGTKTQIQDVTESLSIFYDEYWKTDLLTDGVLFEYRIKGPTMSRQQLDDMFSYTNYHLLDTISFVEIGRA